MITIKPFIAAYKNGDYSVTIFEDGTKVRSWDGENSPRPSVDFPESLDVKISNACNNNCPWCHENSVPDGKLCDSLWLVDFLHGLPEGVELAIGGGDLLLSSSHSLDLIYRLTAKGFVVNATLDARSIIRHPDKAITIGSACRGLGISVTSDMEKNDFDKLLWVKNQLDETQIVLHLIASRPIPKVDGTPIVSNFDKILVLGHKFVGRGSDYAWNVGTVKKEEFDWLGFSELVPTVGGFSESRDSILAFDNLAIEQLGVKEWFAGKDHLWNTLYMGDEGKFSMYVDAVKKQVAISSASPNKYNVERYGRVRECFARIKTA